MPETMTTSPRKTRKKLRVAFTASSSTRLPETNIESIVGKGLVDAKYNPAVDASARNFKAKLEAVGGRSHRHI